MKKIFIIICLFFSIQSFGQEDIKNAFDFWVGTWDAQWKANDSTIVHGVNVIQKTCDGNVIFEQFNDTTNSFYGNSISVYSQLDSTWHQAWADNQGSYINLKGIVEGDTRIFQSEPQEIGENVVVRRMVYYNISKDGFLWDWEVSIDGGETWNLQWQILYTRLK